MSDFDDLLGTDAPEIDLRSEKAIQNDTLVELSALPNSVFWQHTTGKAWQGTKVFGRIGDMVRLEPGMVVLRKARPVSFGLVGSGDIIGAVGGRPVAVEVKDSDGRQRVAQATFERAWVLAGGIYVLGRSKSDILKKVKKELKPSQ